MYRELVAKNLERALRASKKNSPGGAIFCVILAALLGVNAYGLLVRGRGIVFLFTSAELCGILSAAAAVVCLLGGAGILISGLKSSGKNAFTRAWNKYLAQVRALGNEDEVFARIDRLDPVSSATAELRFDDAVVAGTSPEDPDRNFVYPTAAIMNAGTGLIGSVPFLYLHFDESGKVVKKSLELPQDVSEEVVQRIRSYRPDRWPENAPAQMPEE